MAMCKLWRFLFSALAHSPAHIGMPAENFRLKHNYSIGKSAAETAIAAVAKPSNVNGNVWFCSSMYVIENVSAVVSNTINESEYARGNTHTDKVEEKEKERREILSLSTLFIHSMWPIRF